MSALHLPYPPDPRKQRRSVSYLIRSGGLTFVVLILAALAFGACSSKTSEKSSTLTPDERNAAVVAIANQFATSDDVEAAKLALSELHLPNPGQSVLALAESYIADGKEPDATVHLVALAKALGPVSRMAEDYLAQQQAPAQAVAEAPPAAAPPAVPTDTPTSIPPTNTPEPTVAPTDTPQATATPTDTPVPAPRVVAASLANVRSGPGTAYPVVNSLRAGQEADVLFKSANGGWWQIRLADGSEGWVNGSLVSTSGPVDAVAVAQNVAPPPATATPVPQPAAPVQAAAPTNTPAPAPKPSGQPYALASLRLRPMGQDAQVCGGGDHVITVKVVDAGGNPIDGVRVREIFTGIVRGTGEKGPGTTEFDIYKDGGGQIELVDEGNNPVSPQTRGMSSNLPDFDLLLEAGYCNCKPYPDAESCRAGWEARDFRYFPLSHYVYEVVFKRTY